MNEWPLKRNQFCIPPVDHDSDYYFYEQHLGEKDIHVPSDTQPSSQPQPPPPRGPASYRYEKPTSSFDQELTIWIDQPVSSMSISPSSRDVVLAARKGLIIIDLENPYEPPRVLNYVTRWEVADVQWNPHLAKESWVVSTSNQKALIWNLSLSAPNAVEQILHGHRRAISDVNWSPHSPVTLATCSVDAYVHLWDLRTCPKPATSFCAWTAGATQVKFNRKNEYLVASTHDRVLKIWDSRKGSSPIHNITAHRSKISGIDWSRKSEFDLATCGQDKYVKFWNLLDPEKPVEEFCTTVPARRARHTPFGNGLMTMPKSRETNLVLYKRDRECTPVHEFRGHTNTIREFVWRVRGDVGGGFDEREFQLITWSKDQHLRLWPISQELLQEVGHTIHRREATDMPDQSPSTTFSFRDPPPLSPTAIQELSVSAAEKAFSSAFPQRPASATHVQGPINANLYREHRSISSLGWMQVVRTSKGDTEDVGPASVSEEVAWVSGRYQHGVKFEMLNLLFDNSCTIALHGPWSDSGSPAFVRVRIVFPPGYPGELAPRFEVQKTEMISAARRDHIAESLANIAATHLAKQSPCLEECVRFLLAGRMSENNDNGFDRLAFGYDDSDDDLKIHSPNDPNRLPADNRRLMTMVADRDDANVPFPRICGATFSTEGKLVCFFSPLVSAKRNAPGSVTEKSNKSANANAAGNVTSVSPSRQRFVHPRSYECFEEYKAMARLPRRVDMHSGSAISRNTLLGAEGLSSYDELEDLDEMLTIPSLYFKFRIGGLEGLKTSPQAPAGPPGHLYQQNGPRDGPSGYKVGIQSFAKLMPVNRALGKAYTLLGTDPIAICSRNAAVAFGHDRPDLQRVWQLAALVLAEGTPRTITQPIVPANNQHHDRVVSFPIPTAGKPQGMQWGKHPLGSRLIEDLLNHYDKLGDAQTCALLSCVFTQPFLPGTKMPSAKEMAATNTPIYQDYFFGRNHREHLRPQARNEVGEKKNKGTTAIPRHKVTFPEHYVTGTSDIPERAPPNVHPFWTFTPAPSRSDNALPYLGSPFQTPSPYSTSFGSNASLPVSLSTISSMMPPLLLGPYHSSSYHAMHHTSTPPAMPMLTASMTASTSPKWSLPFGHRMQASVSSPPALLYEETDKEQTDELPTLAFMSPELFDEEARPTLIPLMISALRQRMDAYMLQYADHLYRWGLLEQRAELLKFVTGDAARLLAAGEGHEGLEMVPLCSVCSTELTYSSGLPRLNKIGVGEARSPPRWCLKCERRRTGIKCSVCHLSVRGLAVFCLECGHGGHTRHIQDWFSIATDQTTEDRSCPEGCGCSCVLSSGSIIAQET